MRTRSSVRWILFGGYAAAAALLAFAGFVLTRDEPAENDTSHQEVLPRAAEHEPQSTAALRATPRRERPREESFEEFEEDDLPIYDEPNEERDEDLSLVERHQQFGLFLAQTGSSESALDEASRAKRMQDLVQAEVTPAYEGSQFIGLRVGRLPSRQASFIHEAGLSKGDLIVEINGRRAEDPEADPSAMFRELSSQEGVDLLVIDESGGAWRRSVD